MVVPCASSIAVRASEEAASSGEGSDGSEAAAIATRAGPPEPRKAAEASAPKSAPSGLVRPSLVASCALSLVERNASTSPPAIVAIQSGSAAAIASGSPCASSLTSAHAHGCPPCSGVIAGAIVAASSRATAARADCGAAFRPNAGTSITVGASLAHPSPSEASASPCSALQSASAPDSVGAATCHIGSCERACGRPPPTRPSPLQQGTPTRSGGRRAPRGRSRASASRAPRRRR